MCIHPEVRDEWHRPKVSDVDCYHSKRKKPHDLPSHAQWVIRNTHFPSNHEDKFAQEEKTEWV